MIVTARIVGFLILFVLITATLSIEYFVLQGANDDDYAAGKWNMLVSKRKTLQVIKSEMRVEGGRKMAPDSTRAEEEARKKIGIRSRIARESYEASIVAFTADYRGPRHHPPKNN